MSRLLVIACLGCLSPNTPVVAQPNFEAPAWMTPRRHFSFSTIVFDLDSRAWSAGWRGEALADCSNAQFHCLSSETLRVALPRNCTDLSAGRWAVGDVRTEIVYRQVVSPPPIHGGSGTNLYLGDPNRPNVLFAYDPSMGLTALYWSPGGRLDFGAMAGNGRLENWLTSPADAEERDVVYHPRRTFGGVGACSQR